MSTLKTIIEILARKHRIVLGEQLLDGHMGVPIFRAQRNNETIVVKIGFGPPVVIQEVQRNITGYKAIRKIGAGSIIPRQLHILDILGFFVIVMEDLGLTFKDQSKISGNPLVMFKYLIAGLREVYRRTLVADKPKNRGYMFLKEMEKCLIRQYQEYLLPDELINSGDLKLSQRNQNRTL